MKKILKAIIGILFIILMISFSYGLGDASTATNTVSASSNDFSFFSSLVNLLNIIWLPFAIIAGKLFTNELAYGANFHLDTVLFNIWQFSRTVANYILGFILIVGIFGIFVGKTKNILSLLGKITIASVLINVSWFLMMVLIDISTILLVAVGSLPMHLMGTSFTSPVKKIEYCSQIDISPNSILENKNGYKSITVCEKGNIKQIESEEFFSKMNDMSGPLFFIGTSILNIDKNWGISTQHINENSNVSKSQSIKNILHLLIILLFVIPIILLVIIGVIRVFWLWIYIGFSPLIILDHIFGGKNLGSKTQFKLSNIIGLIFQPVIVVMAMGISIIFLTAVQTSFVGSKQDEIKKSLGICLEGKSLCINKKPVVTVKGNLFEDFIDGIGGLFGYIIITILTFSLLWGLLKIAFHSTEITSSIADRTFEFAQKGLEVIPIVPIGKGKAVGIGAIKQAFDSRLLKKGFASKTAEQASRITDLIGDSLGLGSSTVGPSLATTYSNRLEADFKNNNYKKAYNDFAEFIEKVKKEKPDVIPKQDSYFKQVVWSFLNAESKMLGDIEKLAKMFGISKKKDKELTIDDFMDNNHFATFLTNIIKDPSIIKNNENTINLIYHSHKTGSNKLDFHIKDM